MLCGATAMPMSAFPCSGPASVEISTFASAGWFPGFSRNSWRRARLCPPGPTNQKSVPGVSHRADGMSPAATCSTSSPRAIDPLAWTTTPPWAATVLTGWLPDEADGAGCVARTARTLARESCPGLVTRCSGWVLAVPPTRFTSACPCPAVAGAATSATPVVAELAMPADGHARITDVAGALCGGGACLLAPSDAVRPKAARAYTAPSTTTTPSGTRILLAVRLFTSQSLLGRAEAQCPSRALRCRPYSRPCRLAGGPEAAAAAREPGCRWAFRRAALRRPAAHRRPGRGPGRTGDPGGASRPGFCVRRVPPAHREAGRSPAPHRDPGPGRSPPDRDPARAGGPAARGRAQGHIPATRRLEPCHTPAGHRPGRCHIPAAHRGPAKCHTPGAGHHRAECHTPADRRHLARCHTRAGHHRPGRCHTPAAHCGPAPGHTPAGHRHPRPGHSPAGHRHPPRHTPAAHHGRGRGRSPPGCGPAQ